MSDEPKIVYRSVDLAFDSNPLLFDRRGQLVTLVGSQQFNRFTVQPNSVDFEHPRRKLTLALGRAFISWVGPDETNSLTTLFQRLVAATGVTRIKTIRMGSYHSLPVAPGDTMKSLVAKQSNALQQGGFDLAAIGEVQDVGSIFSLRCKSGREVNLQFGPMERHQWQTFATAKVTEIESDLPALSWAIGLFDTAPVVVSLETKELASFLDNTLKEWETFAKAFVSK